MITLQFPPSPALDEIFPTEGTKQWQWNGIGWIAYKPARASDAQLRDRTTHTGTQAIETVEGLEAALASKLEEVTSESITDATSLGKELLLVADEEAARLAIGSINEEEVLALKAGPFLSVQRTTNYFNLFNPVVLGNDVAGATAGVVWTAGMLRHSSSGTVIGAVAVLQGDGSWSSAFDPSLFDNIDWTIVVQNGITAGVQHFSRRNGVTTFVSSFAKDTDVFGVDANAQTVPVSDKIGWMASLSTDTKTSLVDAINEINDKPSSEFYPADEVFRINFIGDNTTEVEIGTQIPGLPSGTLWEEGMLISPDITESSEDNSVLVGGSVGSVWEVNSDDTLTLIASPTERLSDEAVDFDRVLVFPTKGTYLYSCREGTDRRVLKLSASDTSAMRHTEGGVSRPLAEKIDGLANNWRLGDVEYFNISSIGNSDAVVIGDQVPGAPEGILWAENMLKAPDPGNGLGESPDSLVGTVYRINSDGTTTTIASPTIRNSDGSNSFNRIYNFLYKGVYLYTCRNGVTRRIYKLSDKSASGLLYTGSDGFPISIEEKIDEVGDLADLDTTDKSSIVNAINEARTTGSAVWGEISGQPAYVASGTNEAAARTSLGVAPAASGAHTGTTTFETVQVNNINENVVNLAAGVNIDLTAGSYFYKTITGVTAFTRSNVVASGKVASFTIEITNGGNFTVSWFAGVKWDGGTQPVLTTNGIDILAFMTRDGGTTWRGVLIAKDSK